jgi:hypothetical protein
VVLPHLVESQLALPLTQLQDEHPSAAMNEVPSAYCLPSQVQVLLLTMVEQSQTFFAVQVQDVPAVTSSITVPVTLQGCPSNACVEPTLCSTTLHAHKPPEMNPSAPTNANHFIAMTPS